MAGGKGAEFGLNAEQFREKIIQMRRDRRQSESLIVTPEWSRQAGCVVVRSTLATAAT